MNIDEKIKVSTQTELDITRGNTPKTSVLARLAVDWIDEFLKS
jgi:hypothetical protein